MMEKKLIQEIPKAADFHSAVLTTFSFDFHHFESQVLRHLKSKGIINVNVFADDAMLDQAIGLSTGGLKSLSNAYVVNGVASRGAFHPKITLLAGEKDVMILQGSGNITNGGHGKNHEIFGVFYANLEDQSQLPIIKETWNYLKYLSERTGGIAREKMTWLENNCTLLQGEIDSKHKWKALDNQLSAALVYNEETSCWSQLINLLPAETSNKISVVAPFYDESGTFLNNLKEHFQNATIKAFIQDGKGIHPHKMQNTERVDFLAWESTERASDKVKKIADRKLHAKIIIFETNEMQYCLFGSPNATIKAFGTENAPGANDEFAVVLSSPNRNFRKELGLDGIHKEAKRSENKVVEEVEAKNDQVVNARLSKVKLLGVDQDGVLLTIYQKSTKGIAKGILKLFDACGTELESYTVALNKEKWLVEMKSYANVKRLAFVQLFNENNEELSNKQIVNSIHDIINTNPSQENRRLLRLASIIELGNDKVFDVIDFMNTLRSSREPSVLNNVALRSISEVKEPSKSSALSYDEVFALREEVDEIDTNLTNHNSIHIWDAIEKYFNQLALSEDEEDMDDEEEGSASSSRKRKEKIDRTAPIQLNSLAVLDKKRRAVEKFFTNYQNALINSSKLEQHMVGLIDFAMFLIVMKQLIQFSNRKITFKVESTEELGNHVFFPIRGNLSELKSFTGTTLNILGRFVNLLNQYPIQEIKDEYTAKKLEHYKTLSYRTALFTLAITKETYAQHPNGNKWTDIIAYNCIEKFGAIDSNLEAHFEEFLKNVSIPNLNAAILIEHIRSWKVNHENLDMDVFVSIPRFGICSIEKKIPETGQTKFLKIARPGFNYNVEVQEFLFPELYDCSSGKFIKSKQSLTLK